MGLITASSLSCILRKCVPHSAISQAKQTHAQILVHGFIPNITLQTDLLLVYSKCGVLQDARKVFDKMVERNMHSWNILIASYAHNCFFYDALGVFDSFLKMGFRPDHFTLPPVFKACAGIGDSYLGKMLHSWVIRIGFEEYVVVGSSVWIFMRNVGDALECFRDMLSEGVKMDSRTVPSILSVCGGEGDLMKGKEIHGQVVKNQIFGCEVAIGNSLIDMYAKCGCLHDSEKVFTTMSELNLVTWTSMISCYGVHGKGHEALALFKKMKYCGFQPNCVTITAILASCSHSGLIEQGRKIFYSINLDYGFEPSAEHYACMVDLLGRFGYLEEAFELIKNMKSAATASVWGALLAGCLMHKNIEIGEIAAHCLFELEPRNSSNYIALCSMYDSLGIWTVFQEPGQK
ncbi:Pentatricopeptide repeat-containing protein, mitochondrial [Vitis vinifera]|uniref:Pentatricopeptide repeat-containing protein, mitochondrial n=1 Tax=Vitis vinifera TaxID=29760 RepID=A0A438DBB7_VITVI|nr:Pentatricopeptide repeat-containing protein, mitochondrial [Vitis vinifera]